MTKTKEECLIKNGLIGFDLGNNQNKIFAAMEEYAKSYAKTEDIQPKEKDDLEIAYDAIKKDKEQQIKKEFIKVCSSHPTKEKVQTAEAKTPEQMLYPLHYHHFDELEMSVSFDDAVKVAYAYAEQRLSQSNGAQDCLNTILKSSYESFENPLRKEVISVKDVINGFTEYFGVKAPESPF